MAGERGACAYSKEAREAETWEIDVSTTNLTLTADDGTLTGRETDGLVDYTFNLASVPSASFVRFTFLVSNVQTGEDVDLQVVIGGVAYKLLDVPNNNNG